MFSKVIVIPFMKPAGMALFPFILINCKDLINDQILIRHEVIHLKQQLELLIIPFYVLYFLNYLVNLLIYRNHHQAYMAIVFEREAYLHDRDPNYLSTRKFYCWFRFL